MVLNILLITISQSWPGTPYIVAFFLLLNLVLLAAEAPKLLHLAGFKTTYLPPAPTASPVTFGLLWLAGYAVVLSSIPVSFYSLVLAYVLAAAGVATGLASYSKGGRAGKAATPCAGKPVEMTEAAL